MNIKNSGAEFFIPDNKPIEEAMARTTHMATSAHQDDIEIMAYDGISRCFAKDDKWFMAVVVTDGAGSSRKGLYKNYTDQQMKEIRKLEQKKAAFVGEYGALALLDYTSADAKSPCNHDIVDDLKELINNAKPEIIYTHNLADSHDTHIGVVTKTIQALRELPSDLHPKKLYGCEVWRSLDWVISNDKVEFDVSVHPNIAAALVEVHDSQISGGKRYDLATQGRRLANSTYSASHQSDTSASCIYGVDLTPLIKNPELDIILYIHGFIDRFKQDVTDRIKKTYLCNF